MSKRSTKFYRKNEAEVMERLGLKPTKNSGAGWIEKEDGENEYYLCQLKSTDNQSISIKQNDLRILEYHAQISHKIPVFVIQFLNTGEVWLMARPEDMELKKSEKNIDFGVDIEQEEVYNESIKTKGADAKEAWKARQRFYEQKEREQKEKEEEFKNRSRKKWQKRNFSKKE